jgi:hypothetical protein
VVFTYGGLPVAPHLIRRAHRRGARVAFALHSFSYLDATPIREADAFRVPSEFARRAYRERAGRPRRRSTRGTWIGCSPAGLSGGTLRS